MLHINSRTKAGKQRWSCRVCGASSTISYDDAAAKLDELLAWLMSKMDWHTRLDSLKRDARDGREMGGTRSARGTLPQRQGPAFRNGKVSTMRAAFGIRRSVLRP